VKEFYRDEGYSQSIARSAWFEKLQLFLILLNAVWIGFDTERQSEGNNNVDGSLAIDTIFLVLFATELYLRFDAFVQKSSCIQDGWFVFDTVLVALMSIEIFLCLVTLSTHGTMQMSSRSTPLQILRIVRVTRFARLAFIFQS